MSLGDKFPIDFKIDRANKGTQVGAVLRLFVEDTNPPKVKFFIVIGLTEDRVSLASIYINSDVNMVINYSQELRDLHLPLSANDCDFLDHDSFVDCSQLQERNRERIYQDILNSPEAFVGTLNSEQLSTIRNQVINAKTIKGKIKKKFGFYGHTN